MITNYTDSYLGCVRYIKTWVPLSLCLADRGFRYITIGECVIKSFEIINNQLDMGVSIENVYQDYLGCEFRYIIGPLYVRNCNPYLTPFNFGESYNSICLMENGL